ncbi:MAG: CPBP family intramembrane metalloprotease [Deltaproteobacteria bacterium]|nr:CPBP family intramembrane metalloprotease [Deltaproteobacteria bacterium]
MASAKVVIGPIDAGKLMVVFCLMAAVEAPLRLITWHEGFSPMVLLATSRFIEAALIIGVALRGKNGLSVVGLRTGKVLSGFRRGLLWSAGFGGIVLLVYISLQVMGVDPLSLIRTHLPSKSDDLILYFLVGGIISPVTEELFFRGVVYGFLRRWGVMSAVLISSLVFVLAHHTAFTGLFFIQGTGGIVFALSYEFERNLMVPITLHVLGNLAIFTLSLLNG